MAEEEGRLARWSRRKRAARDSAAELDRNESPPAATPAPGNPPAEAQEPPELPDPATLEASSDFKPFLGRGVPIETHRAALRRLWRLDPIYNHMDGLDDYCEDYTDQAKVVKGMRTAYRVGRGFLEQIDKAADAAPQVADAEPCPTLEKPVADPPGEPSAPSASDASSPRTSVEAPRRRPLPKPV